jgi:hypothetical protein
MRFGVNRLGLFLGVLSATVALARTNESSAYPHESSLSAERLILSRSYVASSYYRYVILDFGLRAQDWHERGNMESPQVVIAVDYVRDRDIGGFLEIRAGSRDFVEAYKAYKAELPSDHGDLFVKQGRYPLGVGLGVTYGIGNRLSLRLGTEFTYRVAYQVLSNGEKYSVRAGKDRYAVGVIGGGSLRFGAVVLSASVSPIAESADVRFGVALPAP